jgi:Adenylate and Guanylate cyclase catalytic domain
MTSCTSKYNTLSLFSLSISLTLTFFSLYLTQVTFFALKIEEAVKHKSKSFLAVMDTMAVTVSSYAQSSETTTFPFETFPYYESVASQFRNVSGTSVIVLAPLVQGSTQRNEWGPYSIEQQGWLEESYETMGWEGEPYPIQGTIYDISDSGVVFESVAPLTMPLWQRSPPPKDTGIINYNLLSNEHVEVTYAAASATKQGQLGPVMDTRDLLGQSIDDDDDTTRHPESLFVQPVRELVEDTSSNEDGPPRVVATLVASLPWDTFFSVLSQDGGVDADMVLVVESTCPNQDVPVVFTYELDGGDAPIYLGLGDLHDTTYDHLVHYTELMVAEGNVCRYILAIYPSTAVEEQNTTTQPIIFAVIMAMLFLAAAIFFLVYDYFVQRRQREAMNEAARSNAIVSSLFPAEIADRLFNNIEQNNNKKTKNPNKLSNMGTSIKDIEKNTDGMGQKFRLKSYLDEEGEEAEKNKAAAAKGGVILESKPIADLFPNTTVLFADIAGFTAWSSVREPSQVFTLLETVYKAFDKTAKRRKVFKVETVGDCYVSL